MENYRIIIVGAGVAGASLAYFLTRLGETDIIVIDSEKMAGVHSSGRSNSNFIHLFEPPEVAELSVASEAFLYNPPAEFSERSLAIPRGALVTVSEKDVDRHSSELRLARELGIRVEDVSARDVVEMVPILRESDITAAAYYPDSGPIDTAELIALYTKHARRLARYLSSTVRFSELRQLEIGLR